MSKRLLVKLRSGDALRATVVRARLEPLYDRPTTLAAAGGPQWFIVEPAPSGGQRSGAIVERFEPGPNRRGAQGVARSQLDEETIRHIR